jgi:hypothetical protein
MLQVMLTSDSVFELVFMPNQRQPRKNQTILMHKSPHKSAIKQKMAISSSQRLGNDGDWVEAQCYSHLLKEIY